MKRRPRWYPGIVLTVFLVIGSTQPGLCWGKDAHKIINRVAVESLPGNLPAFLRTHKAIDEIEYLGPEPDRWRSPADSELSAAQAPEHFIDLELADQVAPAGLPSKRGDFLCELAQARSHNPQMAGTLTAQKVGLLPWIIDEWFERLRVDMHQYRTLRATHRPLRSAQQAVLYDAGILGHFIADGSQPLHTTINFNGWVEARNPERFTRGHSIHHRFEATFVHDNIHANDIQPLVSSQPKLLRSPFRDFVIYLRSSHARVPELYRLEKIGDFRDHGTAASRTFTAERMAAGATMLRDAIYTAWVQSASGVNAEQSTRTARHGKRR